MKTIKTSIFTALIVASTSIWAAEDSSCKNVKLGAVNWTDVTATTAITQVVLESLGYKVKETTASQQIVLASLADKKLDVYLGYWQPTMQVVARPYLDKKQIDLITPPLIVDAQSTMAVPDYVYEGGLKSFDDIAKFKDKLGNKIYVLEPGSGANRITGELIKANKFGLEGFSMVESSEAAMLTAVKRAVARKEWVVFFAWKPHPMNLQIEGMKYLAGSQDAFGANEGASTVSALTADGYSEKCPNVGKLVHNLNFSSDDVSKVMASILDRKKPEDAAKLWLKDNPAVLDQWLAGVTSVDGEDGLSTVKAKLQ